MKSLAQFVGTVVLILYVLSWLGLADFNLCIGKPGACHAQPTAKPQTTA